MGDALRTIGDFYTYINKGLWYIVHPKDLAIITWNFIDEESFWICMLICLATSLGCLCGIEKCKKFPQGSIMVYIAIKMLSAGGLGK